MRRSGRAALVALVAGMVMAVVAPGAVAAPPDRPVPGDGFHIQFAGTLSVPSGMRVVEVDGADTAAEQVARLAQDGHLVACYMSAGSWEDWRADADTFPVAALGRPLDGWPGERWLDVRSPTVLDLMRERLAVLSAKGCRAVEFDNVDGYANNSGFDLTRSDQIAYDRARAVAARAVGLSPGLKNATDLVPALAPSFDWALNEECVSYRECGAYRPFTRAGKPVFVLEYGDVPFARVCRVAARFGLSAQVKHLDLDAYARRCPPVRAG
jgi:hypothetical protein